MDNSLFFFDFKYAPILFEGALQTFFIASLAFCIGLLGGHLLGLLNCRRYRFFPLGFCIDACVILIRGTPLTIQALIIFFLLPELLHIQMNAITAGIITLGGNSVIYVSEFIRGSINTIPKGQWETCEVLGYGRISAFFHIIFPQVFRNVLPALVGEYVTIIKESGILIIIGVSELSKVSKEIFSRELNFSVYLVSTFLYLSMTLLITFIGKQIEKRGEAKWST